MNERLVQAAIIALGIIIGCFSIGGRYEITRLNEVEVIRVDRWTGSVMLCGDWRGSPFGCIAEGQSTADLQLNFEGLQKVE